MSPARTTIVMAAYGPLSTLFRTAHAPPAPREEVAWYASRLPRDAGSLLQGMSGTGNLLLPLLDAGFGVHGADASEAMLAACNARVEATGRDVRLFRQNMATLNLPFRYGAAFIAAGSFQALADRVSAKAALSRLRAHLVEPGLLILDLFVPEAAEHPPGAPLIEVRHATLSDGSTIVRRSETRFDVERRRIDIASRYERRRGARVIAREDEALAHTWYSEAQIGALLEDAGFVSIRAEPSPLTQAGTRRFAISARG